jgi:hypothetical protein
MGLFLGRLLLCRGDRPLLVALNLGAEYGCLLLELRDRSLRLGGVGSNTKGMNTTRGGYEVQQRAVGIFRVSIKEAGCIIMMIEQ